MTQVTEQASSGAGLRSYNPRNGSAVPAPPATFAAELEATVNAADAAGQVAAVQPVARAAWLTAIADALDASSAELAALADALDASSAELAALADAGALSRWVRPVAYQDVPDAALPDPLRDANPWRLPRRVDGTLEQ